MVTDNKSPERRVFSETYFAKRSLSGVFYRFCRAVLLFGLCFLILQPLLNKLSVSFMGGDDLFDATVIAIPRNFTLENYRSVGMLMGYWPSLFQTIAIVLVSALLQVAACTLAAYGFARYKFPFKKFWFGCVMLVIIVPPHIIMASLYLNFRFFDIFGIFRLFTGEPINMLGSFLGYWMLSATGMGLKSGLYIFILRQYFRGVPRDLEEAAYIDGCGRLKTFARIMLPDATPMLVSCFLFSFVWQWTDSFYSTLFLTNHDMLAVRLAALADVFNHWWANVAMTGAGTAIGSVAPLAHTQMIVATGVLMVLAPVILLYLVAQRAFVESLAQTGIKM